MSESELSDRLPPGSRDSRGQSEVLGTVLVLGLVIAGTTVVITFGSSALTTSQQAAEIASAEHTMAQLDSKASLVGFDSSYSQRVDLGISGTRGSARVNASSGHITITRISTNTGTTTTILDTNLGAVVYENGETTIAYQGGGVWKRTSGGSTMISPPEFHYRSTTLTLPLILITGDTSLDSQIYVSNAESQPVFPIDEVENRSNPLAGDQINVTVTTPYYRAWGRFLEERTGGTVSYNHAKQTVTATLVAPENQQPITHGAVSTSPAKQMHVDGQHGDILIDSYNSSSGGYASTRGSDGTIVTSGGVDIQHGTLNGSLISGGGEVKLKRDSYITGDLAYGGTLSTDGSPASHVGGTITNDGTAPAVNPIDGFLDQKQTEIRTDPNVNSDTDIDSQGDDDPTNDRLAAGQNSWTLTAGKYYLETFDLKNGERLTLNNTDGPIEIFVERDVRIDSSTLEIVNASGGTVRIYVDHRTIDIEGGSTVSVSEDRSGKLWMYGGRDTHVVVEDSGTRFVGVIYAPSGNTYPGRVELKEEAELYGAIVGGEARIASGAEIHYDEALRSQVPIPPGANVPQLTYLHITTNTVNVTDGDA